MSKDTTNSSQKPTENLPKSSFELNPRGNQRIDREIDTLLALLPSATIHGLNLLDRAADSLFEQILAGDVRELESKHVRLVEGSTSRRLELKRIDIQPIP